MSHIDKLNGDGIPPSSCHDVDITGVHVPAPLLYGRKLIDHIFQRVPFFLFYNAVQLSNSVNILIGALKKPSERYQQDFPVTLYSYVNHAYTYC